MWSQTLYEANATWGLPASLLTDNRAVCTVSYGHGYSAPESELFHLGDTFEHSRTYHPQTISHPVHCFELDRGAMSLWKPPAEERFGPERELETTERPETPGV